MSIEAVAWALKRAPVYEPTATLILIGLANHAHEDGTAAWPSLDSLADYGRCSTRSVQRHLRQMEADGIVRRGDQRHVAHLRADRRPVVYDLNVALTQSNGDLEQRRTSRARGKRGDVDVQPMIDVDGATSEASRGDAHVANGATPTSTEPSLEPSLEPTEPPDGGSARDLVAEWIEHCPTRPGSRVIGQVSRELKILLNDGIPVEVIRAGLAEWHRKRLHPSALASVVHTTSLGPADRPSTADQRLASGVALVARLEERERRAELRAVQ